MDGWATTFLGWHTGRTVALRPRPPTRVAAASGTEDGAYPYWLWGATASRFAEAATGPSSSSHTLIRRARRPAARRANSRCRAMYSALPSAVSIFTDGWP